ncbi:MAG: hypothetical protein EON92_16555 [Burkholderiales bacterium]|nr:MAG: hypothetical protein EON92_16555 [Burkholderiales bacterium]
MLLHLKNVLSKDEVQHARRLLTASAPWIDGRRSAGGQAVTQKQNLQLAQERAPDVEFLATREHAHSVGLD